MKTRIAPLCFALLVAACTHGGPGTVKPRPAPLHTIIPVPVTVERVASDSFTVSTTAAIVAQGGPEAERIARMLATLIGNTRESTPRVLTAADTTRSIIELSIDPNAPVAGEGYELTSSVERVRVSARTPAGLFYGIQTLRQLLPYRVEYTAALARPMKIPAVHIVDSPRYEWRGAMLDVSRHFLKLDDVKRYIDLLAMYKMNRLHLHLSDDQGWRIEIPSWPNLTLYGSTTQVGGGEGGYYTQAQFADLVQYARDRFITIVPEIDMPGHTNAALASYAELNCDGVAPPLYTGTNVGFSNLCPDKDITYKFVDDVVAAIANVSPGEYFHMGGDEVKRLGREHYNQFVERVEKIVQAHGKRMVGWSEIALANVSGSAIVQSWIPDSAHVAAARGSKIILSPAKKIYLDMQYDSTSPIGLHWAAYVELWDAYNWEPSQLNPKLPPESILGLEAPLWSETLGKLADFEYMALPRMPAVAELAWSPQGARNWQDFATRILAQQPRWTAMGVNYRRYNPDLTQAR